MSPEQIEKILMENALAIRELTTISSNTSKDIDRMVGHIEELIPIHTRVSGLQDRLESFEQEQKKGIRPVTLKELLIGGAIIIIGFGTWVTIAHFSNDTRINDNKNQITYLKGRIK